MLTYDRLEYLLDCHDPKLYSGRGMMGRQCLSVETQERQPVLKLLSELVLGCDDLSEAAELVRRAVMDNMGTEMVVYWPTVRIPEKSNN